MTKRIARSLYRELAPMLEAPPPTLGQLSDKRLALMAAIEDNLRRMVHEPDFNRPDRALFLNVRMLFAQRSWPRVRRIIESYVSVTRKVVERVRAEVAERIRPCAALARGGRPCSREAIQGLEYCPSHRHLVAETWEEQDLPAAVAT